MQARFIGDPRKNGEGPDEVKSCGHSFVKGEWADVSSEAYARLAKNNHFEVDADDDGEAGPAKLKALLDDAG